MAWLSVVAVVLMLLMPTVSRELAVLAEEGAAAAAAAAGSQDDREHHAAHGADGAHSGHRSPAAASGMAGSSADGHALHHGADPMGDHCGYCPLLASALVLALPYLSMRHAMVSRIDPPAFPVRRRGSASLRMLESRGPPLPA